MTKRSFIIAFVVGVAVCIVDAFTSNAIAGRLEIQFAPWVRRHGYTEAAYSYAGSISYCLPWCLMAFVFGASIGICVRHPSMLFVKVAALGFLLIPTVSFFLEGHIQPEPCLPCVLEFLALMGVSVALIFLGAWCGARMRRSRASP